MKTILKTYAIAASAILFAGAVAGCTGSFEDYNTNPHEPTPDQMKGDNASTAALIQAALPALCQTGENTGQVVEQMIGCEYGGMTAPTYQWNSAYDYTTYNPGITVYGDVFDITMPQIYTSYFQIRDLTESSGLVYQWMRILRVAGSLRVSDCYGPIPYSKITGDEYTVAYDSMEELYDAMFEDLDEAIDAISSAVNNGNSIVSSLKDADPIYNGDFSKWVKFANTLKLRMAIRISNVKTQLAKTKAEEAANHPIGVMTSVSDSAYNPDNDKSMNPLYRIAWTWNGGEVRISANITSYMNGYSDPRLPVYATQASNGTYAGVRHGLPTYLRTNAQAACSNINLAVNAPMLIMSAAEAWFLKAEAALNGWNILGGTAREFYEKGVQVSMEEHGVEIGDYLSRTSSPAYYTDPLGSYSASAPSSISPRYNDGDGTELNRERILVQKWLANFPNGWETWADIRRTGYPKFMQVVNNYGTSDDVTTTRGMRRLRYPASEYNTNADNVNAAVGMLGGEDKFGTDLWWAKRY